MSTLAEIEEAVPHLSAEELAALERIVRKARQQQPGRLHPYSVLDLKPVRLGQVLRPLGDRAEWHDEMLEGRV